MGYNWRNTLGDYAATSGILAGFCFTLIVFILGWSVSRQPLCGSITYGHVAVFLTGIASVLYIAAADLFLTAKNFDLWNIPSTYREHLEKEKLDLNKAQDDANEHCRNYEKHGRWCYNAGLILVFLGIGFVIAPFNLWIATIVGGLGIIMQVWQFVKGSRTP